MLEYIIFIVILFLGWLFTIPVPKRNVYFDDVVQERTIDKYGTVKDHKIKING